MKKTDAPRALWSVGNVIPIAKLQNHDERDPIDIAIGRGPTSKSSVERDHWNLLTFVKSFKLTASAEKWNWTQADLVDKNVTQECDNAQSGKDRRTFLWNKNQIIFKSLRIFKRTYSKTIENA